MLVPELGNLALQDGAQASVFLVSWLGDSLALKICIEFFGLLLLVVVSNNILSYMLREDLR